MGEAIHSGADFGKELFVFDERAKVVFIHDVVWDGPFWNVKIFVLTGVSKGCDKVEIGKVETEKGGTRGGEHTVEKKLGGGEISCGCICFAIIVDEVATDGEADTVGVSLLGTVVGADA